MLSRWKENVKLTLLLSLLISVTFCIFGPLEIVLSNSFEFWFQVSEIFPTVLIFFGATFVILFLGLSLISTFSDFVFPLIFGFGLALYIQGNFTFVDYGVMDGTPIDWNSFGAWPIINILLWIVLISLPVIFYIAKRNLCQKVMFYVSTGLILVQFLTLGTLFLTMRDESKSSFTVSTNNLLELSNGKNIVVILADGFDGQTFAEIVREDPSLIEAFDGFTYYADTCGTSLYSQESGITLLTGNQFTVGPSFTENVDAAYQESPFFEALKENNYSINIYPASSSMLSESVTDDIDNIVYEELKISSIKECGQVLYKVVAFRYAPHILKPNFWYSSMEFSSFATANDSAEVYTWDNINMYNRIVDGGITNDDQENSYQFIWIQGPHSPVVMDRYCSPLDAAIPMDSPAYSDAQYEQAVGVVRIFTSFIDGLKEKNLYDNTTIIFAADHGWNTRQNPLLLIKEAGKSGNLQTSYAPISMIEDYLPTMMYLATGEKEYGATIFDITETATRERPFYIYDINNDRTYNSLTVSYIPAGAFGLGGQYTLGEKILFTAENNGTLYFSSGISGIETDSAWSLGTSGQLVLHVGDVTGDLVGEFQFKSMYAPPQQLIVSSGGQVLYDQVLTTADEPVTFSIPASCVENGTLVLDLEYPGAVSPESRGESADSRELAFRFLSIRVDAAQP